MATVKATRPAVSGSRSPSPESRGRIDATSSLTAAIVRLRVTTAATSQGRTSQSTNHGT